MAAPDTDRVPDLRLHGFPLQGQPLTVEIRGPVAAPFAVRIDSLPAPTGACEPPSQALPEGAFAGSRAASDSTRRRVAHSLGHRVFAGSIDSSGVWRTPLEAAAAGTEILARGFASLAGDVRELDALELDILPPSSARRADDSVSADPSGVAQHARVELENRTDFVLDLGGWTLRDERGNVQVLMRGTRLSSRSSTFIACDAFDSVRPFVELVLSDDSGREIDRAVRAVAGSSSSSGSPSAQVGQASSGIHGLAPRPCDPSFEDLPDLDFLDSNCDGIDGTIARAIFVATTGTAYNPGTIDEPVSDVNLAIQIAAADPTKDHVYVSEGNYPGLVTLVDGVSVWGGYSAAHGWKRSNAYVTTFSVGGVVSGNKVGVIGSNIAHAITLGSVTITTSAAPANGHNYGIVLQNCPNVTLQGVTVVAGVGGTSSDGIAGASGHSAGSFGTNGGVPGGGSGGQGSGSTNWGGSGGAGGNYVGGWDGSPGGGPNGGAGGIHGGFFTNGGDGSPGGVGADGAAGVAGQNVGTVVNNLWVSNGDGGQGAQGQDGGGGGGGGGGGANLLFYGGGGGGGGGGGQGGFGGTGGTAGGSSFALFLAESHVSLQSCHLSAGGGRDGGQGGALGYWGAFTYGGDGGCSNATCGGRGGAGGDGGYGGGGAGGGGGDSYAVLVDPLSAVSSFQSTTLATSVHGAGGAGGTLFGHGHVGQNGHDGEAVLMKIL
jgi:hypothetical protein